MLKQRKQIGGRTTRQTPTAAVEIIDIEETFGRLELDEPSSPMSFRGLFGTVLTMTWPTVGEWGATLGTKRLCRFSEDFRSWRSHRKPRRRPYVL